LLQMDSAGETALVLFVPEAEPLVEHWAACTIRLRPKECPLTSRCSIHSFR
jgi:hypothetical protein